MNYQENQEDTSIKVAKEIVTQTRIELVNSQYELQFMKYYVEQCEYKEIVTSEMTRRIEQIKDMIPTYEAEIDMLLSKLEFMKNIRNKKIKNKTEEEAKPAREILSSMPETISIYEKKVSVPEKKVDFGKY